MGREATKHMMEEVRKQGGPHDLARHDEALGLIWPEATSLDSGGRRRWRFASYHAVRMSLATPTRG